MKIDKIQELRGPNIWSVQSKKLIQMLLDLEDPTHVLRRTQKPILEPHEWYENEGHKG
jgi:predicted GH43/DUF377 family glycosyl hydrolase